MTKQSTIGDKLRQEREKLGLSVDEVHQKIKIHPHSIEKLEKDEYSDWPGGSIYVKGFLKQYADFLSLNVQEILSEYETLGIRTKPVEFSVGNQKNEEKKFDARRITLPIKRYKKIIAKSAVYAGIFLAALLLIFTAVRGTGYLFQKFQIHREEVREKKAEKKMRKELLERQKAAASPNQNQVVRQQPVQPVPVPKTVPVQQSIAEVNDGFLNSPARGNFPSIRSGDKIILSIFAETDVWMRVSADEVVLFERILKRGSSEEWMADTSIQVRFGRPEGALLNINGVNIGKPGDGQAKNVLITRDGMKQV